MAVVRTLIGNVRGPQGEDGSSFEFKKTYASVAAMNNDFSGSDTQTGDYVLIATASADNADNGKMYRKGNSAWIYVAKISGPTGATGPAGPLCPLDTSMAVTVAGQAALDAALGPTLAGKLDATGDSANNTVTYTSDDVADGSASAWETVQPLTSEEKHESLFAKISKVIKNVRFLYKLLGTTDISGIGSGTVTDILSALNTGKFDKANVVNNLTTTTAGYALDAREGKTLADNVSTLNDAKANMAAVTTGSLHDITKSGNYYLTGNVSGKPTTEGGIYLFSSLADDSVRAGIFYSPYKTDAGLNVVYSLNGTEFVNKIFGVFRYTVSGTTSTSGAIAIPAALQGKALFGFAPTNFTGFVVQRDQSYFTVCKNDMSGPLVNTAVSFNVFYSYLSS